MKPETADLQTNSTNAKRVKYLNNLQQITNKKLAKSKTNMDYVGSAAPPQNHLQCKGVPTRQYTTHWQQNRTHRLGDKEQGV